MVKLWQRYFALEILKTLGFALACFYLLFVIIDYTLRTKAFHHIEISSLDLTTYYLSQFSKRAALLLPFSLLIASIKVLSSFSANNEIIALLAGGISLKRMTYPLLWIAFACALFLYANFQWLYPLAFAKVEQFESAYFRLLPKNHTSTVNTITLTDGSTLIYQNYDPVDLAFVDVYWVRNPKDLYRIQRLYPATATTLKGEFVDHLIRNQDGQFERISTAQEQLLPELMMHPNWQSQAQSIEQLSFGQLWNKRILNHSFMNDRQAQIASQWHLKLALPLLCFLVIIAPAPWCLRFRRHSHIFLIYSFSIAFFLTFFTSMDAALILSENRLLYPAFALWAPILICLSIFGWRYSKL